MIRAAQEIAHRLKPLGTSGEHFKVRSKKDTCVVYYEKSDEAVTFGGDGRGVASVHNILNATGIKSGCFAAAFARAARHKANKKSATRRSGWLSSGPTENGAVLKKEKTLIWMVPLRVEPLICSIFVVAHTFKKSECSCVRR